MSRCSLLYFSCPTLVCQFWSVSQGLKASPLEYSLLASELQRKRKGKEREQAFVCFPMQLSSAGTLATVQQHSWLAYLTLFGEKHVLVVNTQFGLLVGLSP